MTESIAPWLFFGCMVSGSIQQALAITYGFQKRLVDAYICEALGLGWWIVACLFLLVGK